MNSTPPASPRAWQFGLHPAAVGAVVRAVSRVDLPTGEALRFELVDEPTTEMVHLQYYIATSSGGWALWISVPPEEIAEVEAVLSRLVMPEAETPA